MIATIGIIAKNEEKYIKQTLKSIIEQNFDNKNFEIILVDGNSTDNTQSIINEFINLNSDYNIKMIIETGKNSHGNARNIILDEALGKYIAFTDADCIVDKNWLKILIKEFKNIKNDNLVAVGGIRYPIKTKAWKEDLLNKMLNTYIGSGGSAGFVMKKNKFVDSIGNYNALYNKEKVGSERYLPIAWGEDFEFNHRLINKGYKIALSNKPIIYHRQENSFISFIKQMYWYGWGQANVWKKTGRVRLFAPLVALFVFVFFIGWCSFFINNNLLYIYFLVYGVYLLALLTYSIIFFLKNKKKYYLIAFPLFVFQHFFYGTGFIKKLFSLK